MRHHLLAPFILCSLGLAGVAAWVITGDDPLPRDVESSAARPRRSPPRTPARGGGDAPRRSAFLAQSTHDDAPALEPAVLETELPTEEERESRARSRLDGEGRDAGWIAEVTAEIDAAFEGELFGGASVRATDCRTTMCRIDIDLADEQVADTVLDALPMTPPFATNGLIQRGGTPEAPQVTLYFARDGHRVTDSTPQP